VLGVVGDGCILRRMDEREDPVVATPVSAATPAAAPATTFAMPRLLPPLGEYLQQTIRLGLASIRPAMPALVIAGCYRFGMGIYSIFSGPPTAPPGYPEAALQAATIIVGAGAYLPLLVLVHTPFLPLQDALLRSERRSFFDGVKHVLERVAPFGLSGLAQSAIVLVPAIGILTIAALFATSMPESAAPVRALLFLTALLPIGLWVCASLFFLCFATPALILDGAGPLGAIRTSVGLVRRHAGGLLGRLFLSGSAIFLAFIFLSLPSSMIAAVSAVAGRQFVGAQIAGLVWTSVVSAALFPFSVAALMTLYRALVSPKEPAPAGAGID